MLNRCDTVLEAIGETHRLRVHRIAKGLLAPIYTKIEFVNPGGGVKGPIAQDRVEGAEADGRFEPAGAIVETTSGNAGVGLSKVAEVDLRPVGNSEAVMPGGHEIIDIVTRLDPGSFWNDPFHGDSHEVELVVQQAGP